MGNDINRRFLLKLATVLFLIWTLSAMAAEELTHPQAANALQKAVRFFRARVATEGGYLWRYSSDLKKREGEGKASASTVWVQPPGTPAIGAVYLRAYQRAEDAYYLEAAVETGLALVNGQLASGGWDYRIEFDPEKRKKYAYLSNDGVAGKRNTTTLDDNTTQSALSFLIRLDRVLQFRHQAIHNSALVGLESLLKAQYPNGAWPQRFSSSPDPAGFPVLPASYPDIWSRAYPHQDYRAFYTFNDNTIADTIHLMLDAAEIYSQDTYRQAALKAGDFIILAQMPAPQPAWAQQYNSQCQPSWARKFEPPSITGGESQGVMRTLIQLYRRTGQQKYLEPIPSALDYLTSSLLPDGRLARFYELKTNHPLYFTRQYELVYTDGDLPTHYAFKVSSGLVSIRQQYEAVLASGADQLQMMPESTPYPRSSSLANKAIEVVRQLDERGAWVETNRLKYHGKDDPSREIVNCRTFIQNVDTLSKYLSATK